MSEADLLVSDVKDRTQQLNDRLRQLDEKINAARVWVTQLESSAIPRDEALQRALDFVDSQADEFIRKEFQQFIAFARPVAHPGHPHLLTIPERTHRTLYGLFREQIKDLLRQNWGELRYSKVVGPPLADRPALLEEARSELAELEAKRSDLASALRAALNEFAPPQPGRGVRDVEEWKKFTGITV